MGNFIHVFWPAFPIQLAVQLELALKRVFEFQLFLKIVNS